MVIIDGLEDKFSLMMQLLDIFIEDMMIILVTLIIESSRKEIWMDFIKRK